VNVYYAACSTLISVSPGETKRLMICKSVSGGFEGSEVDPEIDLTDQRRYDISVNGWYGNPLNTYSAFSAAELLIMCGRFVSIRTEDLNKSTYLIAGSIIEMLELNAIDVKDINERILQNS